MESTRTGVQQLKNWQGGILHIVGVPMAGLFREELEMFLHLLPFTKPLLQFSYCVMTRHSLSSLGTISPSQIQHPLAARDLGNSVHVQVGR